MRQMYNIKMTTMANRLEVLEVLKKNLGEHSKIVEEAREGYFKEAEAALLKRLADLKAAGLKKVVSMHFSLQPPVDHSAEFKTIIGMLEMHSEDTIELTADEYRQLVENKWEWMDEFLASNSAYSATARHLSG